MPPRWSEWRIPSPDYYEFWPTKRREWQALSRADKFAYLTGGIIALGFAVAGLPIGIVAFLPVIINWHSKTLRPEMPPDLVPDPLQMGDMLVEAQYHFGGSRIGQDVGCLAVIDGWLVFEGAESSFSLKASELDTIATSDPRIPAVPKLERAYEQGVVLNAGQIQLRIEGINHENDVSLCRNVFDWAAAPSPSGEPKLPPLSLHPSLIARSSSPNGIMAMLFLIAACGRFWRAHDPFFEFLLTVAGLLVLWSVVALSESYKMKRLRGLEARLDEYRASLEADELHPGGAHLPTEANGSTVKVRG